MDFYRALRISYVSYKNPNISYHLRLCDLFFFFFGAFASCFKQIEIMSAFLDFGAVLFR